MGRRVIDFLGADGIVAQRLPGYEERPQQLELAELVESALGQGHSLLAEAGTGVGKSFAYLLPAILHAEQHYGNGPIVVSTGNTTQFSVNLGRSDAVGLPLLQW